MIFRRPLSLRVAAVSFALCIGFAAVFNGCLRDPAPIVRGPGDGLSDREGLVYRGDKPFSGTVQENWPGGSVRTLDPYRHGKKEGEEIEYYPSGKIHWKRAFKDGEKEGLHAGWWENGQKMFEYHFHKGLYKGTTREWYPSGVLAREGHYEKGVEAGLQRAWRENGVLYTNYEAREGRQYGVINSRVCYSVKDGKGVYSAAR